MLRNGNAFGIGSLYAVRQRANVRICPFRLSSVEPAVQDEWLLILQCPPYILSRFE